MQHRFLALLVLREIAGKTRQQAAVELDDAGADAVEEGAVVGNEEERHAGFDQQRFQPFDGGDVEVVGRLVEQQHLRRHSQRLGQRQALLLAAGEAADLSLRIEPEAGDDLFRLRLVGPGAACFQFLLQLRHARQQRLVIAAFAQAVRHRVVLGEQRRSFAHAGNHRLEYRMRRVEGRLLRHVADANAGLHPDLAVIEPALAGTGGKRGEQ